jgi:hypothetical protein
MLPWELIDEIMENVKLEVVKDTVKKANKDAGGDDMSSGGDDSGWN